LNYRIEHGFGVHHLETSCLHREGEATHQPFVVLNDQHRFGVKLITLIRTLFLHCGHRQCRSRQLIASFDFAGRVTELVQIPRTNFDHRLGFAWHGAFRGMGHIAFLAFKNVQVGKTIEPPGLSA
jgi:hypothetical protein